MPPSRKQAFFFTSNQPVLWDVIDPGVLTARQAEDYQHAITYYQPWPMSNCMSLPHLVNDMVEIPVSLPDDEMLFDRLNFSPSQVGTIWREILSQTYTHGELFTLQLHPERAGLCASFLPSLLEHARALSPGIWFAKLSEIADWWKVLNDSLPEIIELSDNRYRFRMQNPGSSTILVRSIESSVPTIPFFNNYQLVKSTDFSIQSPSRPIIGLSPNTSRSLAEFLHQQGLIIEFSADPGKYSLYFDQPSFSQDQERTIMARIDNSTQPLVRLWRWPNGAKSALAITGDIDAMILMDFILRLIGS
jgi:hypothetical protein